MAKHYVTYSGCQERIYESEKPTTASARQRRRQIEGWVNCYFAKCKDGYNAPE